MFKPTWVVLALLCAMYFITYIDRVNVATAAGAMQRDLGLSNTQLGTVFSAFGYPYLLFQVAGGWVGDRFGPRRTLVGCGLIWAAATILTGLVDGFATLLLARLLLGFGEGATFPTATRAMQTWTQDSRRGFAQGLTHAFSRLGNAVTPPLIAALITVASWRGAFVLLGLVSLVWGVLWGWYFRDAPGDHPGITTEELAALPAPTAETARPAIPWAKLLQRLWPVTLTYFCYGWCLWLYLNWLPLFFEKNYHLDLKNSVLFAAGVFCAGFIGDMAGGALSDLVLRATGNLRLARLGVTILGFVGALISLATIWFAHDLDVVAMGLAAGFFFAELVIGPMWAIPMDIAPRHAGTAAGLMNSGSALAAIVSPQVAGYVIDQTGNWYLPFLMSMALLLLGAVSALLMHPERPLEDEMAPSPLASTLAAD
jgi:MFS family permease